ncbi:enoyl-CoA hydratase/isomerase family protein [Paraferrimonas sedimenticola]|uniref:3-hydroxyisobutyryl-CoA hydrolase n=1 Tax=Paraferrimonas sedimenticola TaxID=375674 RepID=A0AA37RNN7_9GAMM|nr:enoyl-CoA hydratase/isomerase family protein [Paraferrimonas sedimenticola]GLP94726.1 enoyl-CoA hydratase [Paraferrimonas sedimenticola]
MVEFELLSGPNGKQLGVATLNAPKSLNALSFEMVKQLSEQLLAWQNDERVAAVLLKGSGEKAFCAGGDVVSLFNAAKADAERVSDWARDFFTYEYQVDYLIHTYAKPVVVWGSGIVMGGGLGLMAGASHRVVTETSRIAMPEVTIGLYPDVGASYFLNRMPGKVGLFLGMTGHGLNAEDARYVGLADYSLANAQLDKLIDLLSTQAWDNNAELNHRRVKACMTELSAERDVDMPAGVLADNQAQIDELMQGELTEIIKRFESLEYAPKWLARAAQTMASGSPISLALINYQHAAGQSKSLATCFREELAMSVQSLAYGDFVEGVRALLIDKDRQPKFQYERLEQVPEALVKRITQSPWEAQDHPLANLEQQGA